MCLNHEARVTYLNELAQVLRSGMMRAGQYRITRIKDGQFGSTPGTREHRLKCQSRDPGSQSSREHRSSTGCEASQDAVSRARETSVLLWMWCSAR